MSEPCSKATEIHDIKIKLDSRDDLLTEMRVKQAEIAGDVSHIKTRIENGMSHTIKDTHDLLLELKPQIEHHSNIIKRIEDIGWLISRWFMATLVATMLGLLYWAITKGYVPHGLS